MAKEKKARRKIAFPKKPEDRLTKQKLLRFTERDWKLLERAAKIKRLSVTALMRSAIFDLLRREGYTENHEQGR